MCAISGGHARNAEPNVCACGGVYVFVCAFVCQHITPTPPLPLQGGEVIKNKPPSSQVRTETKETSGKANSLKLQLVVIFYKNTVI